MTIRYFDDSLNAHHHAAPQRTTVKEMMDFRNYQAFDVGITRRDLSKRFQGMVIRDRQGITKLTVTDPHNPDISKDFIVHPTNTIDQIFDLVANTAVSMVNRQVNEFYRQVGFTMR